MLTSRPRVDPSDHDNHAVAQSQSPSGLQGPSRRSPSSPEVSQTECCGGAGGGPGLEEGLVVVVVSSGSDPG